MYQEVFSAQDLFRENDFHLRLFDASVANYFDLNNPIRFNNFSYSLRELLREKLSFESPDIEVRSCSWFDKKEKVSNADRVRFYLAKGLTDDVIDVDLLKSIYQARKKLLDYHARLSKYTHITKESFGIDLGNGDKIFRETINAIIECFGLINEVRQSIEKKLTDDIAEELDSELMGEIPSELDALSTHTRVDCVEDVKFKITGIGSKFIEIEGTCSVGVELQYGSDSENSEEDLLSDSYPMQFKATISTSNLSKKEFELGEIDTSSFYE